MIRSSIKNRLRSSLALLLLSSVAISADLKPDFRLELNSRLAYHTFPPQDLASHRHTLEFEQKLKWKEWNAVAGVQAYAETAFSSNPRYQDSVAHSESQEIVPRDIYLQYKGPSAVVRVGNQQVVWGEAYGFYFADIVNPKDTRDFGLGDLSKQRIPVPMLNAKALLPNASLQLIYIPKPYFNKTAAVGNDFGQLYGSLFPTAKVAVNDDRSMPLALENGEVGGRATTQWEGVDLSAFYFYYHDRSPNYRLSVKNPSPLALELSGFHPRIHTVGATAATEQGSFLLRAEAVHTWDRQFDAANGNEYASVRTNESTGVLGLEYTRITNWRVGVQLSDSFLSDEIPGGGVTRHRPLGTLAANGPIFRDQNIDLVLSLAPLDGSTLTQLRYIVPVTSRIEVLFGTDLLLGGAKSQFGQYRSASRGYVLLKAFLAGT